MSTSRTAIRSRRTRSTECCSPLGEYRLPDGWTMFAANPVAEIKALQRERVSAPGQSHMEAARKKTLRHLRAGFFSESVAASKI